MHSHNHAVVCVIPSLPFAFGTPQGQPIPKCPSPSNGQLAVPSAPMHHQGLLSFFTHTPAHLPSFYRCRFKLKLSLLRSVRVPLSSCVIVSTRMLCARLQSGTILASPSAVENTATTTIATSSCFFVLLCVQASRHPTPTTKSETRIVTVRLRQARVRMNWRPCRPRVRNGPIEKTASSECILSVLHWTMKPAKSILNHGIWRRNGHQQSKRKYFLRLVQSVQSELSKPPANFLFNFCVSASVPSLSFVYQ